MPFCTKLQIFNKLKVGFKFCDFQLNEIDVISELLSKLMTSRTSESRGPDLLT